MATVGEESDAQRIEREAKQQEEMERQPVPEMPRPITEQGFMQYMHMVEEHRRQEQERQNKFLQEMMTLTTGKNVDDVEHGVTLSDFLNTKPLTFAVAIEPIDAEDWLSDTERKLRTVNCSDEEKVRYATYLLTGPSATWWESIVNVHPIDQVFTWAEFKKKFREFHVPESVVELKRREFENI